MSFTPGPWEVFKPDFPHHPGIEASNASVIIWGDTEDCNDKGGVYGRSPEEAEANARLIAAAPDLLAACQALLAMSGRLDIGHSDTCCPVCGWGAPLGERQHIDNCPVPIAEAAIAKALPSLPEKATNP